MSCYITGYGAALPGRIVTNAELAGLLYVAPEWIEASSGVRERRWVAADESSSDLAGEAVRLAIEDARVRADEIDYLIGCTLSPDYQVPGISPIVQQKTGARNIPAVDIRVGCVGALYSLQLARALIESRAAKTVVCFGAEAQSKGLELSARCAELSMLFGDGAGAVVVRDESALNESDFALKVEDVLIKTDGRFAQDLIVRAPGTANGAMWFDPKDIDSGLHRGAMNGRSVILHAVRKLADAAIEVTERNRVSMDAIDLIVPHQANANLLTQLAKRLSVGEEKIITNVERFGNTSGASVFLALWQARSERRFNPGARVLIVAFGAGFTWGAALGRVCGIG
ncbi:MAG: ketoacyl-ACP synthase III [Acidobacteriota bacterium]